MLVAKFVPKHRAGFVDIVIANISGEDIRKALRRFRFRFTFFLQSATLASSREDGKHPALDKQHYAII